MVTLPGPMGYVQDSVIFGKSKLLAVQDGAQDALFDLEMLILANMDVSACCDY
jgi:hypothetical protein